MHNMAQLPLNEPAGVLVKTTCVDYPGRVAGSFFLKGCNLRCPYCYNTELVIGTKDLHSLNTIQELFDHLQKRQGILSGLVISGGEPLLNPYTPIIIKKAKSLGYKIKLDTNGTLPNELNYFLTDSELKPDFIAVDIKTSPDRYGDLLCNPKSPFYKNNSHFEKIIKQTVELVSSYSSDNREFRTVLVPGLITKEDIKKIADILPKDASWQFAQFRNENCLDSSYNTLTPYTDGEISELIDYAKTLIHGAVLR